MKNRGLIAFLAFVVILASSFSSFSNNRALAAEGDTQLIVHYYKGNGNYEGSIKASLFDGSVTGTVLEKKVDEYGLQMTLQFNGKNDDAYIGFVIPEDRVYPDDLRYVRATNGVAEVWLIDGDPRVYDRPLTIPAEHVMKKGNKGYVAVEDLTDLLHLTYKYGLNGYVFDGAPKATANILTIYHDRDYFEINVDTNRIGSNVTGNMLNEYNEFVFSDVDGFKENGKYYLSLGYIERLFQLAHLTFGGQDHLLEKQFTAYDQLRYAGKPEEVGFSSAKLDEMDQYVQQQIDDGFPAAAIIVVKDGKIVKESAYGYAKKYNTPLVDGSYKPAELLPREQWEPATTGTLFDLASNSKMYATNYAIQKLFSEGKLNLDQKLVDFPGWENFNDDYTVYTGKFTKGEKGKGTITIRDILHHYGGLIPDPEYPNLNSAGELWYQTQDPTDRKGIIDAICKTPLQYKPRTVFAYSDVDYMILGLLVEQITGKRLDQYVEQDIYAKLGITNTMFNPLKKGISPSRIAATELNGNTRDGNISFGNQADGTPVNIRSYTLQGEVHDEKAWYSMAGVAGHAGLFSTVGDMGMLTQLMLNGGIYNHSQLFTQEVRDEFITPYHVNANSVDSSTIGLGWRVHSKSAAAYYYFNWGPSRSTYGHQGWTGTLTIIDPVYNMSITVLTNFRHSPVISPPNGFDGGRFDLSDMVTLSAQVYRALIWDKEQYSTVQSIAPVANIEVAHGTTLNNAVAALAPKTTITDSKGNTHPVDLTWTIADYNGDAAGSYEATGTFELPDGVLQSEPALELRVTAVVTVKEIEEGGGEESYIETIAPVANIEVAHGTTLDNAVAALTPKTTITDSKGNTHPVDLTWTIADYKGDAAGSYEATGTFELPDGVLQSEPAVELLVRAVVTVKEIEEGGGEESYLETIAPVANIEVAHGTTLDNAVAALAPKTTITDSKGNTHPVGLTWTIPHYNGDAAGSYEATGTFELPDGVLQSDPVKELRITAIVTVKASTSGGSYPIYYFASANANLNKLEIWANDNRLQLTPEFAASTTAYAAQTDAEHVELIASAEDAAAKVIIEAKGSDANKINLQAGENEIKIRVRAENGESKTYTLTIQRKVKEVEIEQPEQSSGISFTDITGHWAESEILKAAARNIITGYSDGTFKADRPITRAEFTVMLARSLKLASSNKVLGFTDSHRIGAWAEQGIASAVQAGIVQGFEDGSFRPDAQLSRTEMAVMIARALGLSQQATTPFADAQHIPQWAKSSIEALWLHGMLEGQGANLFAPEAAATRAESAVLLLRMLDKQS